MPPLLLPAAMTGWSPSGNPTSDGRRRRMASECQGVNPNSAHSVDSALSSMSYAQANLGSVRTILVPRRSTRCVPS